MEEKLHHNIPWGYITYLATGVWIIFLYITFLLLVLFSLSTYQFQQEIQNIPIEHSTSNADDIFVSHKCDISGIKNLQQKVESTVVELPCIPRPIIKQQQKQNASDILRNLTYNRNLYQQKIALKNEEIQALEKEISKTRSSDFRRQILEGNLFKTKLSLESYQNELTNLTNINTGIDRIVQESQFYDSFFTRLALNNEIKNAWAIPATLLSIFLALSMGGLGSLITVTIEYLKIQKNNYNDIMFSMYLFRPMLGTITALAVYIAIKSGQVTISGEYTEELSPFLLSFIGVISGLMSEQVYKRLINYGSKVI